MNARRFFRTEYKIPERYDLFLLVLLAVFIVVSHVIWLHIDTRPQPSFDPNIDLWRTIQFADQLATGQGFPLQAILEISRWGRPPLYQLLATPAILVFGSHADVALALNALLFVILLIGCYSIGRVTIDRRGGLLAAFIVATMPPVIGMSRIFRPHFATVTIVAVTVALMQTMLKNRTVKSAWLFGFSLGLAGLIHPKALYYLLPPAAAAGLYSLLFQSSPRYPHTLGDLDAWLMSKLRDRFVWLGLLPAGLIGIIVVSVWYLPNLMQILSLREKAQEGFHNVTFGFEGTTRSFWWFIQTSPNAISWPYAILIALAVVVIILSRKELMYSLLATFILMYITHSTVPGALAWMNGVAMLPVVAAMIGVSTIAIAENPSIADRYAAFGKLASALLVFLILCTGLFIFAYSSTRVSPSIQKIASLLGSPIGGSACDDRMNLAFCGNPPLGGNWAFADIMDIVASDDYCDDAWCSLVISDRWIAPYEYYMYTDHPTTNIKIVPSINPRHRIHGYKRWNYLASEFVVFNPTEKGQIPHLLMSPDSPFSDAYQTVAEYELPDGNARRLVRRLHPLSKREAAHIALLDLVWAVANKPDSIEDKYRVAKYKLTALEADESDAALDVLSSYSKESTGGNVQALQSTIIGVRAFQERDYEQAIDSLEAAVAAIPDDADLRLTLAKSYRAGEQLADAIVHAEIAATLTPDNATPLALLGTLYRKDGLTDAAIAVWQGALELKPDMPDICFRLGTALEEIGAQKDAIDQYTSCINLEPEGEYGGKAERRRTELLAVDGEQAFKDKDYERAIKSLKVAVAAKPDAADLRITLAKSYRENGQLVDAIASAETAAALVPDQAAPLVLLGTLYRQNDQADAAAFTWQNALEMRPNMPDVCFRLGLALEELDKHEKAIDQYLTCIDLDPDGEYAQKAERRLSALLSESGKK